MKYDYFYGKSELEPFSYYSLPRKKKKKEKYMDMSIEAKILYSILLNKMNLSEEKGLVDENGNPYVICTINEVKKYIGCSDKKAINIMNELEREYFLIKRKRKGLGNPNIIYVKNIIENDEE